MRRICLFGSSLLVLAVILVGCNKPAPAVPDEKKDPRPNVKVQDPKPIPKENPPLVGDEKLEKQEKYQAALGDAIRALANRQWDDAMTAFKAAQAIDDTEFVRSEIARLQQQLDQADAAKATVKNIETVLADGKAEEAVKLVTLALKEFGGGDEGAKLVLLRLQADALKGVQDKEPDNARFLRYKEEAEKALEKKENNLRAAVLALEMALQIKEDAGLKQAYEGARANLEKYDTLRAKASELRKDPQQLDDALALYQDAAAAWDTPPVRADIDECQLALQKRRQTVSVVNFDVRNDVGLPDAGAALADELLPKLKPKFDLVEREQLGKVIAELKLERGFADDAQQQQELGKLVKVRYLVFGSVSRKVGVTVRARLVDVQTGLVVQTAKLETRDIATALIEMPKLAQQLMSEEFDAPQAVHKVEPAPEKAELLPAPQIDDPAPKQALNVNAAPPGFGNLKRDAFAVLAPPAAAVVVEQKPWVDNRRNRLLFATVELGDFLFRARRFGEAQRQFEFALALDPDNVQIALRLQRVRPLVPPVVVLVQEPVVVVKPRLAVLPFWIEGNPRVVPPSLSYWTPANLSPYFASRYEVVDPGEIYWYMGRMGITMQDLLFDPQARRWLARAAGVRYLVFGSLVETASFDVNTYLVDAEFGYTQGGARINVRDAHELRFRLYELASLTMMTPAEQQAYLARLAQQRYAELVRAGRIHMDQGRYREALREFDAALAINANDLLVRGWRFTCLEHVRFQDFVEGRKREADARRAAIAAAQARQAQLRKQGELARQRAEAEAAARTAAERQVHFNFRFQARDAMNTQAQVALKTDRVGISVSLFKSAMDVAAVAPGDPAPPPVAPVVYQDFARARLAADQNAKLIEAKELAAREKAVRQIREKQLADAQKQLEAERAKAKADADAARLAQLSRDKAAFDAGVKQGQKYLNEKNYQAALAAFQGAQRVATNPKQNEEINNYIDIIVQRQAAAAGKTQKELDAERERRIAAEALAKKNEALYQNALKAAQQALAARNLAFAESKFKEARALYQTDAVEKGLQQIKAARDAEIAADAAKAEAERVRLQVKVLLAEGRAYLDAKNYQRAVAEFQKAKKLAPDNLDVLAGLAQAESALARPKVDPVVPVKSNLKELIAAGQAALKLKNFDAAEKALRSAAAIDVKNPAVVQGLKDIEAGRKALASAKQQQLDYQTAMNAGQKALLVKNYDAAIKSFQLALKSMPGDPDAQKQLLQAQNAQAGAAAAAASFQKAMTAGLAAYKLKNYANAVKYFTEATKIDSTDLNARKQLQQAQDALTAVNAAAVNFQKAMTAGLAAYKLKNYADAVKYFTEATKIDSTDASARKQLQQSQQALAAANQQALIQANYDKAMTTGNVAMKAKRYKDAVTAYKEALSWIPNDKAATSQLQAAQQALQDSTPPKVDPAKQFVEAMQRAAAAAKDKKYADAVKGFQDALKIRPKDNEALAGVRQNQFNLHLERAQQFLDRSMWVAAQTEVEAALKIFPNDPQAKKLLQKAKSKMK